MWYKAGLHEVFPLGRFSNSGLCSLNLAPESFLPQHAVSCLRTSAYPHFLIPAFTFGTFWTTWSECGFSPYMRRNVPILVTATGSYYKCRLTLYSIPTPRLFVQLSEYTVRSCSLPNHPMDTGTLVKHGPLDVVYAYLHIFRWILAPTLLPLYRNFRYFHP